ncbi:hypothetical protein ILYODFUR_006527 [Ilyodon furcidens]|uniref:Uncharacterized protein n=1 Tax=Ilyodon furcidens TaxID=33524 RepID=A0ABV0UPK8_9TELE
MYACACMHAYTGSGMDLSIMSNSCWICGKFVQIKMLKSVAFSLLSRYFGEAPFTAVTAGITVFCYQFINLQQRLKLLPILFNEIIQAQSDWMETTVEHIF